MSIIVCIVIRQKKWNSEFMGSLRYYVCVRMRSSSGKKKTRQQGGLQSAQSAIIFD